MVNSSARSERDPSAAPDHRRRLGPWRVLRETGRCWLRHRSAMQSAALAFYTLISFTPTLMLAMSVAGTVFDEASVRQRLVRETRRYTGEAVAATVENALESASEDEDQGLAATLLGLGALLFGATVVFAQLQDSLNTVWEVQPTRGRMLRNIAKKRALSFVMIVVIGILLVLSLAFGALVAALAQTLDWRWEIPREAVVWTHSVISFVVMTLFFAAIYRILPDAEIAWREVALGALVTSVLFALGRFGIGYWIGKRGIASAYGAAGSLVLLLLWMYYSSLIFLFGAELTRVSSRHLRPHGVRPSPGARRERAPRETKP